MDLATHAGQAFGNAEPSLTRDLLIEAGRQGLSREMEDRIKWTTGESSIIYFCVQFIYSP